MTKFEAGKTYQTRSIGDSDCIISVTITKRTDKTVTCTVRGVAKTFRVFNCGGNEAIKPWGNYSMCPIVEATDTKTLRPSWEVAA